jgi:hypothetical protein
MLLTGLLDLPSGVMGLTRPAENAQHFSRLEALYS